MSINNFYHQIPSEQQQQQNQWWQQQQMDPSPSTLPNASSSSNSSSPSPSPSNWPPPPLHHQIPNWLSSSSAAAAPNFNLNAADDDSPRQAAAIEKEGMFEKPLTPSDVGKLNRLVIPKQHAERYFPLQGADAVEKGLLLGFEDEAGKCWRFRYSYWNSSQSYVLTKGWSRYVKEKQLDAGDVVLFERHRGDQDRLFIGWRRRGSGGASNNNNVSSNNADHHPQQQQQQHYYSQAVGGGGGGWGRGSVVGGSAVAQPYLEHGGGGGGGGGMLLAQSNVGYQQQPECLHAPGRGGEKETRGAAGGNSRRLRLFGVNMEWQPENDDSSSSTAAAASFTPDLHLQVPSAYPPPQQQQYYSQLPYHKNSNSPPSSSSTGPNHMVRYT
ncbi:unnamed protein product [Linum trigynum]|uniref:TF-B3 domain-containing protein n=1 Tax=Linum trigynum TaxID=586398 RepID=A0AAV2CVD6_9ROSI